MIPPADHAVNIRRHEMRSEQVTNESRLCAEASSIAEQDPAGEDCEKQGIADDCEKCEYNDA
jgi:hypothetical protein